MDKNQEKQQKSKQKMVKKKDIIYIMMERQCLERYI